MAKFDKNMKNEFLNEDELYEEEFDFDTEANGYGEELDDNLILEEALDAESEEFSEPEENRGLTGFDEETASSDEESVEDSGREGQQLKWYVVHTYSGYENKVKLSIEKMVENRGMQDLIRAIEIPMEDVIEETKKGERKVRQSKLYPGYVIVNMVLTNESWYLIRNTQGVTGFVGQGFVGQGTDPIPLSDEEVRHMGIDRVRVKIDLKIGDRVRIIDGAYRDYMLVVDDIDLTKEKIKGRLGQVTMDIPFDLVEKMV